MTHDLILRNATIIDGTGGPRLRGDVAIDGDRISMVGDLSADAGRETVDLTGRALAPGFIDAHTHDDGALLTTRTMIPKISQGVTTVVIGNCGISLAPLTLSSHPPPPFTLLGGHENFRFASLAAYIDELKRLGIAVNAVPFVGHTTLRKCAMTSLTRAANDTEIGVMQDEVDKAMRAGAFGLSTGLDYDAAVASSTAEVKALAKVAAKFGGIYATHTRNYFDHMESALEEAIDIAAGTGSRLIISHHQVTGRQNFGKSAATLKRFDRARHGIPLAFDAYPYAASSTVLRLDRCDKGLRIMITWSKTHPELSNHDLADIAKMWNCSEHQAAMRLLPAGAVYFQLEEQDVRNILTDPHCMIGSDGLPHDQHPHPRLWGTFGRVLGHYSRDLGLFSLETAVHRMTGLTALEFGITDRGIIAAGAFADIVVFDPDTIIDRATYESPAQPCAGIERVLVNGTVVWQNGGSTNARPGRVLSPRRIHQSAS
jgi:N-acyl-D-amino-acid deacylase